MPRTKIAFQQIREESRQHILDRAARVFTSKGLANTKISDLARAANISQGLLYRYFQSKEDVFIELLEQAVSGAVERAQTALQLPGTPRDRLLRLTEEFLVGMSKEPIYHQIFSQALALPGRVREIVEKLGAFKNALHQLIVDGQAKGQIIKRDPDQLVLLYLSCLYGLAAGVGFDSRELKTHFPDAESILQILKA